MNLSFKKNQIEVLEPKIKKKIKKINYSSVDEFNTIGERISNPEEKEKAIQNEA